jgi:hypothetical protein
MAPRPKPRNTAPPTGRSRDPPTASVTPNVPLQGGFVPPTNGPRFIPPPNATPVASNPPLQGRFVPPTNGPRFIPPPNATPGFRPPTTATVFERCQLTSGFVEVQMNDVKILYKANSRMPLSIGTQDLNGCTAIAVLGEAVLLAHIAPTSPAGIAKEDFAKPYLQRLLDAVKNQSFLFPGTTTTWGMFAFYPDGEKDDEFETYVRNFLKDIPGRMEYINYRTGAAQDRPRASGQLVVMLGAEGTTIFAEDKELKIQDADDSDDAGNDVKGTDDNEEGTDDDEESTDDDEK